MVEKALRSKLEKLVISSGRQKYESIRLDREDIVFFFVASKNFRDGLLGWSDFEDSPLF